MNSTPGAPAATTAARVAPGAARWRGPAALATALLLGGAAILWIRAQGGPAALRTRWGSAWIAAWLPLQVLVTLSPASDFVPCAVLNGTFFGFPVGAAVSWATWMLTASIEFAIGRRTGSDFGLAAESERLPSWLRSLPLGHPAVLVVGHWIPVSSSLVNFAAGALGVPYARLLWCTAIAMVPAAAFTAAIGARLSGAG
ncbi:VTT domain-containing protein [bacterium]|nr:VTT domain-containing protein [bacterium]